MKYNICVPIPIKSANILELKSIIAESLRSNPNLIELRYDYIDDIQQITKDFVNELLANVQPKIPVIFTFRAHKEGGQMKIDETVRFEILKTLVLSQPNYLDIEMNTEKKFLGEMINLANLNDVNLIISYHNFDETPSYELVTVQINNILDSLREEYGLDSQKMERIILKMIFTAQTFEDNFIPLKLCRAISEKNIKIISFCMGTLGIFSRIVSVLNGSFLTYGSIDEKTAPGQIDIKNLREALKVLQESE